MNAKTSTWERRGHTRTLKSGKVVYVRPSTCSRHDSEEAKPVTGLVDPVAHERTYAPSIDELLEKNNATAKGNILTLYSEATQTEYPVEFSFKPREDNSGYMQIFQKLPKYISGEAKYDSRRAHRRFDKKFETHVILTCLEYICCAVSKYRERPLSKKFNFKGYNKDDAFQARAYCWHGQRRIAMRNFVIVFDSNDEHAMPRYVAKYDNRGKTVRYNPIRLCDFAVTIINLTRDILILSETLGQDEN